MCEPYNSYSRCWFKCPVFLQRKCERQSKQQVPQTKLRLGRMKLSNLSRFQLLCCSEAAALGPPPATAVSQFPFCQFIFCTAALSPKPEIPYQKREGQLPQSHRNEHSLKAWTSVQLPLTMAVPEGNQHSLRNQLEMQILRAQQSVFISFQANSDVCCISRWPLQRAEFLLGLNGFALFSCKKVQSLPDVFSAFTHANS